MPVSAIIDNKIFCVHGGLSPDLTTIDQLLKLSRPTEVPTSGKLFILPKVYYVMFYGLIQVQKLTCGKIMIEESVSYFQKK